MHRALLLVIMMIGCTSDREHDCAQVREVYASRRDWSYDKVTAAEKLAKMTWRDPQVEAAVRELLDGAPPLQNTIVSPSGGDIYVPGAGSGGLLVRTKLGLFSICKIGRGR